MTWTRHGHQIPGSPSPLEGEERPPVARCGGPRLCAVCEQDSGEWASVHGAR